MRAGTLLAVLGIMIGACVSPTADDQPAAGVTIDVVAEGLVAPIGLAEAPDGRVLVAEDGTGNDDLSAGVSIIESGSTRRLISGFPSGRDSGDLSGSALVGVGRDGTVFVGNFGAGHLWTVPFNQLDATAEPLSPDDLGQAMLPLNSVRLTNPFDITFDLAGRPVVSDASGNGVAVETDDGATQFIHRFDTLTDPASSEKIDAVPTGIARVGDEYFVTLTGGCPYPDAVGELVAIKDDRSQRTVAAGLFMPIDVAVGPDGTIWVLEFADFEDGASCFTGEGYLAGTGRLSRLTDKGLELVVDGLDNPGAVLPHSDGTVYVSEVFSGRVIAITVEGIEAAPPPTGFSDVADKAGLTFVHGAFDNAVSMDPVAAMGGGLCWIDYDADGWMDLYLVNSYSLDEIDHWQAKGGLPASQLYRNQGGRFTPVDLGSTLTVRGNGCLAADLNGDGWTDLYVTADGPNQLLINHEGKAFTEEGELAGLDAEGWSTAAAAGDVNADGILDVFVASYVDLAVKVAQPTGHFPQDHPGLSDHLFLGVGAGPDGVPKFRDATQETGLTRSDRGLGAVLSDLDLDGDLDLYVANDGNPNRLYLAQQTDDGLRFSDATSEADVGDSGSGMGIATGDYDLDGLPDLLVTNWHAELNALYRSEGTAEGNLTFAYSTFRIGLAGLGNNQTGWGTAWMDVDLDSDLDLMIVNGHVPVEDLVGNAELVRLYLNQGAQGGPGQFIDGTTTFGLEAVGPRMARGAAAADYDNDGDLDLAVNVIGGPVTLLQNDVQEGNWLIVALESQLPGTVVEVALPDGSILRRELLAGSSYLATEDPRLHFGLGEATAIDITVRWPGGDVTRLDSQTNRIVLVGN